MDSTPQREQRQHPRAAARTDVQLAQRGRRVEAVTVDLSVSGARCLVSGPFQPFEKVTVGLALPQPDGAVRRVGTSGVVVRSRPLADHEGQQELHEVAVFFHEISPRAKSAIEEFVRARLSEA